MECPFKPGDEVVCVDDTGLSDIADALVQDREYVVRNVCGIDARGNAGVQLVGLLSGAERRGLLQWGYRASRFRKVQRRNSRLTIEALSVIKDGFEEPKRTPAPAKKRERV